MKKSIALGLGLLLALTLAACGAPTTAETPKDEVSTTVGGVISEEEVKKIVLTHAGIAEKDVTFSQIKLDERNNLPQYEIKMYNDFYDYVYRVEGETGKILTSSSEEKAKKGEGVAETAEEATKTTPPTPESAAGAVPTPETPSTGEITLDQAKTIALNHAGITEGEATIHKAKRDWEDGRLVYEIEFYAGNSEYDYDIDVATGAVVKYDQDIDGFPASTAGAAGGDIGEGQAKEIALQQVPGANNNHIRIKQDMDDGRLVYEGEIIYDSMEYEFEIDAASGTVLEWSMESVFS